MIVPQLVGTTVKLLAFGNEVITRRVVESEPAMNPWWGGAAFVLGGVATAVVLVAWAYRG